MHFKNLYGGFETWTVAAKGAHGACTYPPTASHSSSAVPRFAALAVIFMSLIDEGLDANPLQC
jgi:hypothetical protein